MKIISVLIYGFFRFVCKIGVQLYYRKINVIGLEKVDYSKPVIYSVNHTNAFMDAILLGVILDKKLHFLARGDVFNKKWKATLLNLFGLIPIYRVRDGIENHHSLNEKTFEKTDEIFLENKDVIIYSEGDCVPYNKIRALKKGTARMAFRTFSLEKEVDLQIMPVSIFYERFAKSGGKVIIHFSEKIRVADYKKGFEINEPKSILALNAEISSKLKKGMIEIEQRENEKLFMQIFQIIQSGNKKTTRALVYNDLSDYNNAKNLSDKIENLSVNETEKFEELSTYSNNYFKKLSKLKMGDNSLVFAVSNTYLSFLFVVLGSILILPFYYIHTFPIQIAKQISKKIVKNKEFVSSIEFSLGFVFYLIFIFLMSGLIGQIFELSYLKSMVIFLFSALPSALFYNQYFISMKYLNAVFFNNSALKECIEEREKLTDKMRKFGINSTL